MTNYIVYSGTVGWTHEGWNGGFYPEGLPDEWQLSFYNTQFRCVYLPSSIWMLASDQEVAQWLSDVRNGFRFILQLPEEDERNAEILAERFGERGLLEGQASLLWLEEEPDLRQLAQKIRSAAQSAIPLCLISRHADLSRLGRVNELMEVLGV